MKRTCLKILAAVAFFCAQGPSASGTVDRSGELKDVAQKIADFAKANGINKISVLAYMPKDGVDGNETDYISETMASYLAGHKKPALIERALLEKVLKEARLSSAAGPAADKPQLFGDILLVDAVVTGTVFAAGERLKILTRLIDLNTGRVLLSARAETGRELDQFPGLSGTEFQWNSNSWTLPPADFRDAVSDSARNSCAARKQRLDRMNTELVDAKALYWAAKMKEPGFSVRGLTRNPGTEITDPETKARFYKLLGAYYRSGSSAPPGPGKLPGLLKFMEEETRVYSDCGSR